MKRAVVFLAEGVEETEFITVVDLLRRAGVETTVAAVTDGGMVTGGHGIRIAADCPMGDVDAASFDAFVLPGGGAGTENLARSAAVKQIIVVADRQNKLVAAICAAPLALHGFGILSGRRCTSYPSVKDRLTGTDYRDDDVVVDGNIVTSRGVGTAIPFSLALVGILCGAPAAERLAEQIVYRSGR